MQKTKEELTYDEFINNVLETRGRFACGDEYCERHHITPKCMGGMNEEDNLIDLFAREHFEAHRLLVRENPENHGLIYAWSCMAKTRNDVCSITADEYEEAKKSYSEMLSKKNKGANNPMYGIHKCGKENPMFGKCHTEDSKKKNSEAHKGKKFSEEVKDKLSKIHKGKVFSKDHKRKIGESHKRPIICIDNNVIYKSATDAELYTGVSHSHILAVCRFKKEHKTAGGFTWRYLYDQILNDGTVIQGAISLGLIGEEEALKQLNTQQND